MVVNDLGVGLHGEGDDVSPAGAVVAEIEALGGTASSDGTSVTDFEGVAALVERTVATYGRLGAVVNNAGIVRDRIMTSMTEDDFDLVVGVHLKGSFTLSRHACAYWKERAKAGADRRAHREHHVGRRVVRQHRADELRPGQGGDRQPHHDHRDGDGPLRRHRERDLAARAPG